jgi:hypothetical protein
MGENTRKLLLYCDVTNSKFVLRSEGEAWEQTFTCFERACDEAEARVTDTVALILYTEHGQKILETTVSPAPAELVQLRHPLMGGQSP